MTSGLDVLRRDPPALHGGRDYGLQPAALERLAASLRPGDRTLETGAGHSTVVFAAAGCAHTCVVPAPAEVEAIRRYCERHAIALDAVTFHVARSEEVLPALDTGPLDLVLVDGSHSFPQAFLDWFYTASALRVGGVLVVDDVQLWTAATLRDFLVAEPGWTLEAELHGTTAFFRKDAGADVARNWVDQPFVSQRSGPEWRRQVRMARRMLRHGQTRSLARGLVRRLRRT